MKINICGFNTKLHHKDFKRQDDDLPEYSIYYVYCECSADHRRSLEEDLPKKLIPELRSTEVPAHLAEKFEVKDTNYGE